MASNGIYTDGVRDAEWDGRKWVPVTPPIRFHVIDSTRYVKRAPLGMMLTRNDGFRMVAP